MTLRVGKLHEFYNKELSGQYHTIKLPVFKAPRNNDNTFIGRSAPLDRERLMVLELQAGKSCVCWVKVLTVDGVVGWVSLWLNMWKEVNT